MQVKQILKGVACLEGGIFLIASLGWTASHHLTPLLVVLGIHQFVGGVALGALGILILVNPYA